MNTVSTAALKNAAQINKADLDRWKQRIAAAMQRMGPLKADVLLCSQDVHTRLMHECKSDEIGMALMYSLRGMMIWDYATQKERVELLEDANDQGLLICEIVE